jgi:hypothetical protein
MILKASTIIPRYQKSFCLDAKVSKNRVSRKKIFRQGNIIVIVMGKYRGLFNSMGDS